MADGTRKAIEQVQIGDWVWAEDPETGEHGPRQVTDLIVGQGEKTLVDIDVDGHIVTATDHHPFWVSSRSEWVDAEDLQVGDKLLSSADQRTDVAGVSVRSVSFQKVFNLTIDGLHTYYVFAGEEAILVHNTPGCGPGGRPITSSERDASERMRRIHNEETMLQEGRIRQREHVANGNYRRADQLSAINEAHERLIERMRRQVSEMLERLGYGSISTTPRG